jgi:hypothetical protein
MADTVAMSRCSTWALGLSNEELGAEFDAAYDAYQAGHPGISTGWGTRLAIANVPAMGRG